MHLNIENVIGCMTLGQKLSTSVHLNALLKLSWFYVLEQGSHKWKCH